MVLDSVQIRVLGSLTEKEITTPESYPLSLNALVNACNQRSNRDPLLELGEDEVRQALGQLEDQDLITVLRDSRVPKFEQRIRTVLNLRRDETAVLCLLMLRGPQTPGELRGRSERLYTFDDISSVQSTLERLASRESPPQPNASLTTGPLVAILPRQPGARESRYMHLLSGPSDLPSSEADNSSSRPGTAFPFDRIARLESEVATITRAFALLQSRVEELESKR